MEKRVFTKDMAHIKTAEVIECPDCAFEFGTIHEQSEMPGLYICPNCQESNLEADNYHLKEENKRLREALEVISCHVDTHLQVIISNALEGGK